MKIRAASEAEDHLFAQTAHGPTPGLCVPLIRRAKLNPKSRFF